jgi:hypothetical protein
MSMNPTPREQDKETQKAIDEWLKKGNKIEKLPYGARTEDLEIKGGFYGRKPKKKEE